MRQDFQVFPGNVYHPGQVIARGAVDTGDQVFVDKFSYNFVHPHRGDVFVFRTNHILGIREDPEAGAPFYIKRLTGTPGDELRIDSPKLYVNGELARNFGIARVMSAQDPVPAAMRPGRPFLGSPDPHLRRAAAQLFRDGRQQLQQLRQPLLGTGAGGKRGRAWTLRLLAVWPALGLYSLGVIVE